MFINVPAMKTIANGYNDTYAAWYLSASSNQVAFTFTPAGGQPVDRPIADLAARVGLPCVKGHPTDLLDRHVAVARATGAEAIVKIPSDCPLVDPGIVAQVVARFRDAAGAVDYVGNLHPATWPDGCPTAPSTSWAGSTSR